MLKYTVFYYSFLSAESISYRCIVLGLRILYTANNEMTAWQKTFTVILKTAVDNLWTTYHRL